MAKVTLQNGLLSLGVRGQFGKPNEVGETWCGWSELGDYNPRAGIYQYHWNGIGKYYSKAKFYTKVLSASEAETHRRDVFRNGVTAYHDLTDEERLAYNNLKYPAAQSGFNRFMSKYLKENQ